MKLLQLLRCVFGDHRRDRRKAKYDGERYRSICTGCGKPMVRTFHGWRLARAEEDTLP